MNWPYGMAPGKRRYFLGLEHERQRDRIATWIATAFAVGFLAGSLLAILLLA